MSDTDPYTPPSTEQTIAAGVPLIGERPLASRMDRFLGSFIDGLIIIIPAGLIGFGIGSVMGEGILSTLVGGLAGFLIHIAVQYKFWAATSQSIGKKVMKTQIVNIEDGRPTDVGRIIKLRVFPISAMSLIPYAGNIIVLVDALAIFRKDHNTIHDDIAKTRVIKLDEMGTPLPK